MAKCLGKGLQNPVPWLGFGCRLCKHREGPEAHRRGPPIIPHGSCLNLYLRQDAFACESSFSSVLSTGSPPPEFLGADTP